MDYLFQRVSYLRGLAEGLKISDSTDEGKVLLSIIDTLDEIVEAIDLLKKSTRNGRLCNLY